MEYVEQVLNDLKPDTMYTFTVTVENGVSDQDTRGKDLRSCKLTMTTTEGSMLNQNNYYCILPDLLIVMTFFYYIQDLHHLIEYKHFARLLDGGCPSIQMGGLLAMMCS